MRLSWLVLVMTLASGCGVRRATHERALRDLHACQTTRASNAQAESREDARRRQLEGEVRRLRSMLRQYEQRGDQSDPVEEESDGAGNDAHR